MTVLKLVTKLKVWGIKAVTTSQMKKNNQIMSSAMLMEILCENGSLHQDNHFVENVVTQ